MSKRNVACVFCGQEANTHEHFIPQWLDGLLPELEPDDVARLTIEEGVPGDKDKLRRQDSKVARAAAVEVPGFCAPCNNGWMSVLEMQAKGVLTPMITGTTARGLTVPEQIIAATWFAKFAVVQEAITQRRVPFVSTVDERTLLARQQRPLTTFAVRIGVYAGPWTWLAWRQVGVLDPEDWEGTRYSCSTYVIGKLIGQVEINPNSKSHPFVTMGVDYGNAISIYPMTPEMRWPPAAEVGEEAITEFARSTVQPLELDFPLDDLRWPGDDLATDGAGENRP